MKFFWLIIFVISVVGMVIWRISSPSVISFKDHQKIPLFVRDQPLTVEVVNSTQSITTGLGNRQELGSDGMLFMFGKKQNISFWMKDMKFNLDFIWIADGKIVEVTPNVSAPQNFIENQDQNLPIYSPSQAVDMVLELPAGKSQLLHLEKGNTVRF